MSFLKGMESSYGRWIWDPVMKVKYDELGRRLMDFPGFRVIWNKVIHKNESVGYRFEIGENAQKYAFHNHSVKNAEKVIELLE